VELQLAAQAGVELLAAPQLLLQTAVLPPQQQAPGLAVAVAAALVPASPGLGPAHTGRGLRAGGVGVEVPSSCSVDVAWMHTGRG